VSGNAPGDDLDYRPPGHQAEENRQQIMIRMSAQATRQASAPSDVPLGLSGTHDQAPASGTGVSAPIVQAAANESLAAGASASASAGCNDDDDEYDEWASDIDEEEDEQAQGQAAAQAMKQARI